MQAIAVAVTAIAAATERWAARYPPCPPLSCGNVSVALSCHGPAFVTSTERGQGGGYGLLALLLVFLGGSLGGFLSGAFWRRRPKSVIDGTSLSLALPSLTQTVPSSVVRAVPLTASARRDGR